MNPKELKQIGCKKISWNGGAFVEYYLPVKGDGRGLRDKRLSVIFDEHPDYPVMVWLVIPQVKLALEHVTTIEQFCKMFELLTGRSLTMRAADKSGAGSAHPDCGDPGCCSANEGDGVPARLCR